MRPTRPLSAVLALGIASGACARISEETHSVLRVEPDAAPLFTATSLARTQLEVRWSQRGRSVELELVEHRACQSTSLVPARREDRIVRRPDAMIYWEYGLAALALGLSAAAFVRPESFSTVRYDGDLGLYERDRKTGYRLGGVFAAIGTGFLIGGLVDSVRSRDRTRSVQTNASQTTVQPCAEPTAPASQRPVELDLGPAVLTSVTDSAGKVRFTLPAELVTAGSADPLPTSLHVGPDALALPLLVPGAQADAPSHEGALRAPLR